MRHRRKRRKSRKVKQSTFQKNLQNFYDNIDHFVHFRYDTDVCSQTVKKDILSVPIDANIALYTPPGIAPETLRQIEFLQQKHANDKRQIVFFRNIDGKIVDLSAMNEQEITL